MVHLPPLPHGRRDFLRQAAIWLGFALAYELVRALADPGRHEAIRNAVRIVDLERSLGGLYELDVQRWTVQTGGLLLRLVNSTYWLSQFGVLTAVLLWVYIWRNRSYLVLRNTLFAVNTLALIGYVAMPTAPPRLLTSRGFVDTVSGSALTFNTGAVKLLANPYAAMPSLHAADALVVAVVLAGIVQTRAVRPLFLLWPLWVSFAIVASGNHYFADVLAGTALGLVGLAAVAVWTRRRGPGASAPAPPSGRIGRNRPRVVGDSR